MAVTGKRAGSMPDDRTLTAITRQLRGMGLLRFELTLKGPERTVVREMSVEEIMADRPRLKRANRGGCHVYIRPPRDIDHDLVLLDDLGRFTPDRMKSGGHGSAVVVETSPGSVQAWVRLGRPVPAPVRHEVARELARLYGGDPAAVNPHQAGRLAGFTNQKPEHKGPRGFPFVLLLNAPGTIASGADALIAKAEAKVAAAQVKLSEFSKSLSVSATAEPYRDLVTAWLAEYDAQPTADLSRIDWWVVNQGLGMGVCPDMLASALAEVADRKGRYDVAYAERTVRAALLKRS
jgi:hypothetical protein